MNNLINLNNTVNTPNFNSINNTNQCNNNTNQCNNNNNKFNFSVTIYVPMKIIDNKDCIFENKKKLFIDKCYFMCYEIIYLKSLYKNNNRYHADEYTEIPAKELERALGQHYYKNVISFLKDNKIIEISEKYSNYKKNGSYAKGYKISKNYESTVTPVKINIKSVKSYIEYKRSNAKYRKSDSKNKTSLTKEPIQLNDQVTTLEITDLSEENIRICKFYNEYMFICKNLKLLEFDDEFDNAIKNLKPSKKSKKKSEINCINRAIITVGHIKGETPTTYKYDTRSGRFYYPLVNLRKELRNLLRVDGKKLVEVDIKSSQPFMCNTLYNEVNWEDSDLISKLRKEYKLLSDEEQFIIASLDSKENMQFATFNESKKRFNQILKSGFYEYIAERYYGLGSELTEEKIKRVKNKCISEVLFGHVNQKKRYWKIFCREFPLLAYMICPKKYNNPKHEIFVKHAKGQKTKYDGDKNMAFKLQKAEAEIIFGVVRKLREKNIVCFTIHDSIMVLPEHSDLVDVMIREESKELLGFEAKTSKK